MFEWQWLCRNWLEFEGKEFGLGFWDFLVLGKFVDFFGLIRMFHDRASIGEMISSRLRMEWLNLIKKWVFH